MSPARVTVTKGRPVTRSSKPRRLFELTKGKAEVQQNRRTLPQPKAIRPRGRPPKEQIGVQKESKNYSRRGVQQTHKARKSSKTAVATVSPRRKGRKGDLFAGGRPSGNLPVTQASTISSWTRKTRPGRPPRHPQRRPSETIDIRSVSSERESDSTLIMTEGTSKTLKTLRQSLKDRQIMLADTKRDTRLKKLQDNLTAKLELRPEQSTAQFIESLKLGFLNTFKECDMQLHALLDALLMHLDRNKNKIGYPFTHTAYFEKQLEKCHERPEHVLQRTIMMSIFHTHWLSETFEWNAEGQWQSDPGASLFMKSEDEKFSRPKPDLSFGFAQEAFFDSVKTFVAVSTDLEIAMSPDDNRQLAFPFLFVEVKKGGNGLEEAKLKNLRNAARALYNIHRWVELAKHYQKENRDELTALDKSFRETRIFTFAFNTTELVVRIHRAETLTPGKEGAPGILAYHFGEFYTNRRGYTRDEICSLFNNILNHYADAELLPWLKTVYGTVLDGVAQDLTNTAPDAATERSRPDQKPGSPDSDSAAGDGQEDESNDRNDEEEVEEYFESQQRSFSSQEAQASQTSQQSQSKRKPGETASQIPSKKNKANTEDKGSRGSKGMRR